jgi:hypothetical protein
MGLMPTSSNAAAHTAQTAVHSASREGRAQRPATWLRGISACRKRAGHLSQCVPRKRSGQRWWTSGCLMTALVAGLSFGDVPAFGAQSRRVEPAEVRCPSVLGVGVDTDRIYCDVLIGNEIADGIIVVVPPHSGSAIVTFTLYGRHTYSETEVARGRGYVEYLASTAVATTEEVLARPVVLVEFRTEADLVDRVSGGAGPGGVKAVAPVGGEAIRVTVPEGVGEISIVGLELQIQRIDGQESYSSLGRPIAVISDVQVEYGAR